MIYLQLILSFLKIGLFSFGGGYAVLGLIISEIVEGRGWMSAAEFADIAAIAEMTPGPLAVNAATFIGMRLAGIGGALAATAAVLAPSVIIVSLLAWIYKKYGKLDIMRAVIDGILPVITAIIMSAALKLTLTALGVGALSDLAHINVFAVAVVVAGVVVKQIFKPNAILLMLGAGVLGGVYYWFAGV